MKKIVFVSLTLLGAQSCKHETDTPAKDISKPVISIVTPGDELFTGGDTIHINGEITDNQELSQVKFEIHNVFDGHTHLKKAGSPAFLWDSIINLSGKAHTLDFSIILPVDIASGPYHMEVNALDAAGNEAEFVERELTLLNGLDAQAPEWQTSTWTPIPDAQGHIELNTTNNTLNFTGLASDNMELEIAEITVENESTETVVYDHDEDLSGTSQTVSFSVVFDNSWAAGEYHVVLVLKDSKGNKTVKDVHVDFVK